MNPAAAFAAIFAALYAAHSFADHWVQTDAQAQSKGRHDHVGRRACLAHVLTLTLTQCLALLVLFVVLDLPDPGPAAGIAGLAINAGSHYWIDRRFTLAGLCEKIGKGGFYRMGSGLGTGAYALDQSAHVLMLFVSAVVIASGVR